VADVDAAERQTRAVHVDDVHDAEPQRIRSGRMPGREDPHVSPVWLSLNGTTRPSSGTGRARSSQAAVEVEVEVEVVACVELLTRSVEGLPEWSIGKSMRAFALPRTGW
jgi:hypothetical protein